MRMTPTFMDDLGFSTNNDCPAVLEDIGFSTSYDCLSCQKLNLDLTTSNKKLAEYEKVITPLREQCLKTGKLLKNFNTTKEAYHAQKANFQNLEKQNTKLRDELQISQAQLKQHLSQDTSVITATQHDKLLLQIQSQKYALEQCNTKISNLEAEVIKTKELEKKCKSLETQLKEVLKKQQKFKPKPDSVYEEEIKKLKEDKEKLRLEAHRLKNLKESTINNAAERKTKDILKEMGDIKAHNSWMEATMKEVLETVKNSSVGNYSDVMFPTSTNNVTQKRQRPVKRLNVPSASSSYQQPKKRGRPLGYSPKSKKIVKKTKDLLNSDSDSDVDLVNEIESSFCSTSTAEPSQQDDTIVCEPLTPSKRKQISSQYNIFEDSAQSSSSTGVDRKSSVEANATSTLQAVRRNPPRILNVDDIFDFIIPIPKLPPLHQEESQDEDMLQSPTVIKSEMLQPSEFVSPNSAAVDKTEVVYTKTSPGLLLDTTPSQRAPKTPVKSDPSLETSATPTTSLKSDITPVTSPTTPVKALDHSVSTPSETQVPAEIISVSSGTPIKGDIEPVSSTSTTPVKPDPLSATNLIKEGAAAISLLPIMIKNEKMKKCEPASKVMFTIKPRLTSQRSSVLSTLGDILAENVATVPDIPGTDNNPVVIEEEIDKSKLTETKLRCEEAQVPQTTPVSASNEGSQDSINKNADSCSTVVCNDSDISSSHDPSSHISNNDEDTSHGTCGNLQSKSSEIHDEVTHKSSIVDEDNMARAVACNDKKGTNKISDTTPDICHGSKDIFPVTCGNLQGNSSEIHDEVTHKSSFVDEDNMARAVACNDKNGTNKASDTTPDICHGSKDTCSETSFLTSIAVSKPPSEDVDTSSSPQLISELEHSSFKDLPEFVSSQESAISDTEKETNNVEKEDVIISADSILCAFEMDVVSPTKQTASRSDKKQTFDDIKASKKLARMSKKLSISCSFEVPQTRRRRSSVSVSEADDATVTRGRRSSVSVSESDDTNVSPRKKTKRSESEDSKVPPRKTRRSTRNASLSKSVETKCLRSRKVSFSTSPEKSVKKTRKSSQSKTLSSKPTPDPVEHVKPSETQALPIVATNKDLPIKPTSPKLDAKSDQDQVAKFNPDNSFEESDNELMIMFDSPKKSIPENSPTKSVNSSLLSLPKTFLDILQDEKNPTNSPLPETNEVIVDDIQSVALQPQSSSSLPIVSDIVLEEGEPSPTQIMDEVVLHNVPPIVPDMWTKAGGDTQNVTTDSLHIVDITDIAVQVKDINPSNETTNDDEVNVQDVIGVNVEEVVLPSPMMFVDSFLRHDYQVLSDIPAVSCSTTKTPQQHQPTIPPDQVSRKRKKTKPPVSTASLDQIFDMFVPNSMLPMLVIENDNDLQIDASDCEGSEHQLSGYSTPLQAEAPPQVVSVNLQLLSTLRSALPVTSPIDDQPLDKITYMDMSHMSRGCVTHKTGIALVDLFRKNLCTSNPDIPYLVKTILHNTCFHNVDTLLRVIRNELHMRERLPQRLEKPPINVLVHLFLDICRQLQESDIEYFNKAHFMEKLLDKIFWQLRCMSKAYKGHFIDLLTFGVKMSVSTEELAPLRSFLIHMILRTGTHLLVKKIFTECLNNYSPLLLLGKEHLGYESNARLCPVDCVYLAGLEFYLRYSLREYTGTDNLTYIHQYAVEEHLIDSALVGVIVKEEEGEERGLNEQGLICLKLMLRAQGWTWLVSTLLPKMFDLLSKTNEYGMCRLLEAIDSLVISEILSHRADTALLTDTVVPTLHGLLWSAPSPSIKLILARCLLNLVPLSPAQIPQYLHNWYSSLPPRITTARDYERLHADLQKCRETNPIVQTPPKRRKQKCKRKNRESSQQLQDVSRPNDPSQQPKFDKLSLKEGYNKFVQSNVVPTDSSKSV